MKCSVRACVFPAEADGTCRHHKQFFAYSESLTDSTLDVSDLTATEENPFPALSNLPDVGQPWLRCTGLPRRKKEKQPTGAWSRLPRWSQDGSFNGSLWSPDSKRIKQDRIRQELAQNPNIGLEALAEAIQTKDGLQCSPWSLHHDFLEMGLPRPKGRSQGLSQKTRDMLPQLRAEFSRNPNLKQGEAAAKFGVSLRTAWHCYSVLGIQSPRGIHRGVSA